MNNLKKRKIDKNLFLQKNLYNELTNDFIIRKSITSLFHFFYVYKRIKKNSLILNILKSIKLKSVAKSKFKKTMQLFQNVVN